MAEPCPEPSILDDIASGVRDLGKNPGLQNHLERCPRCARAIEAITQRTLEGLGMGQLGATGDEVARHPTVDRLIRDATLHVSGVVRGWDAEVESILDPPSGPGFRGRFAGYDVVRVAARGSMGVVFEAHDATLQRRAALKVLLPTFEGDEEVGARFLREARTVAAIQHDHIVGIHAAGREKGRAFLVMPFHAEGSLDQRLKAGVPLQDAEVIRIGIQLAKALEVTHAHGVLHRDLKPSNVLLEDGMSRVRLADFGLAVPVRVGGERGPRQAAGTPHYMAPEQARGDPLDARSDLYGLGALLFHLATGRVPHEGETIDEVLRAAEHERPRPVRSLNPSVGPALAGIINRLLSPDPSHRYANARDVVVALARLDKSGGRTGWWRTRNVVRAVGAAAGFVGLALGLGLGMEFSGRTSIVNTWLCARSGDGFYIRGRWGCYARLSDAVMASDSGDVVVARYHGERVSEGFRLSGRVLTIRAAPGFAPVLVATNTLAPMILADGPLALEGLVLISRGGASDSAQLLVGEGAPFSILNCRLLREPLEGDEVLIRDGRRVSPDSVNTVHKPLLVLRSGTRARIRNSLVLGVAASGVGLRGGDEVPLELEIENSLFAVHRGVVVRSDTGYSVTLRARRSVFVCAALVEIENMVVLRRLEADWMDCVVDRTGGVVLRLAGGGTSWPRKVEWREDRVVHAGSGPFSFERRRRPLDTADAWRERLQIAETQHRMAEITAFSAIRMRTGRMLQAADVDREGLEASTGWRLGWIPEWIGEGEAYERFRNVPEYREWLASPEQP